jgi:hypothetical protein
MLISKYNSVSSVTTIIFILLISATTLAQPAKLIDLTSEQYYAKNRTPERKAIVDLIVNQIKGKSSITQADLDQEWQKIRHQSLACRVQIVNQKLYVDYDDYAAQNYILKRVMVIIKYLQKILLIYKIKNSDFILNVDDLKIDALKTPQFIMSQNLTNGNISNTIAFPDTYLANEKWSILALKIIKENSNHPWHKKTRKIFWRGEGTGGHSDINNFYKFPRFTLVFLSHLYPDIIDARFVVPFNYLGNGQASKRLVKLITSLPNAIDKFVDPTEHLPYKYLISIDGNTASWGRVPWIMLSNSVLIKQTSPFRQWFYPALKPYQHYVPVDSRLITLFDQFLWMQNNQLKVQKRIINANNFVKNEFMPENILAQGSLIINCYHKLMTKEKIKNILPPAEDTLAKIELDLNHLSNIYFQVLRRLIIFYYKLFYELPPKALVDNNPYKW